MEQYEKSGPASNPEKFQNHQDVESRIKDLQDLCFRQDVMIRNLHKELQRFKSKLDAHAIVINRLKNNG